MVKVDRATILVSHSGSSYLELSAEKDLKAGGLSLVSADADLSISAQKGEILHIVGENQLTPLFKLSRVKLGLFEWLLGGKPEFEGVRRSAPGKGEMIDGEVAEKALEIVALDSE